MPHHDCISALSNIFSRLSELGESRLRIDKKSRVGPGLRATTHIGAWWVTYRGVGARNLLLTVLYIVHSRPDAPRVATLR
jgi:hypothetical protein